MIYIKGLPHCNCPDCDLPPIPMVRFFEGKWLSRNKIIKELRTRGLSHKEAFAHTETLKEREMSIHDT